MHPSVSAARRIAVGAAAAAATMMVIAQCGGTRSAPTAPSGSTGPQAAPSITSVTIGRTQIEAGVIVDVETAVDYAGVPPDQLLYSWAVQPSGGTWIGDGPRVQWRAPTTDPVPATYTFTVTVARPWVPNSVPLVASSPALRVNDARREMIGNSESFLGDFSSSSASPDFCVRNFADSCSGKRTALDEITAHRATYSVVSVKYQLDSYLRSVGWANCTAPEGWARCALLVYDVEWVRTRRADGVEERVRGTESLRGIYEGDRWWLCEARFSPTTAPPSP
ncbi:MAG TPA: hypothetical protein VHI98_09955 [Vicinamibacterales bacterium]|nr:hypothetical protein [Vicinamibacterales bacterium]